MQNHFNRLLTFSFAFLSLILEGCGYRFGSDCSPHSNRTISIPYIVGDYDGSFTNALVEEVAHSGVFRYVSQGGDLLLLVKVCEIDDENIGFRYDRGKNGNLKKILVPIEMRRTLLLEVELIDSCSGSYLLEPVKLYATIDFDHDYYFSSGGVNVFSLGQLSNIDAAKETAREPLYRAAAKKIIDYLVNSW